MVGTTGVTERTIKRILKEGEEHDKQENNIPK